MDRHSHVWLQEKIMDGLFNCLETKTLNNQFSCNATILALKTSNPKPLFLHMQTIKSKKKEKEKKKQKQNKTQVQWSRAFMLYRRHKASMQLANILTFLWYPMCAKKVLRDVIASKKWNFYRQSKVCCASIQNENRVCSKIRNKNKILKS